MGLGLSEAKRRYEQWRHSNNKRKHLPDDIKKHAVALLKNYSLAVISQTFRVSQNTIRNWEQHFSEKALSFIPIDMSSQNTTTPISLTSTVAQTLTPQAVELNIILPNGVRLTFLHQSSSQTAELVATVIKGCTL